MFLSPRGLRFLIAAAFVAALSWTDATQAQDSKPFSGMAGSWSGTGKISISQGVTERIRCRARYDVAGSGVTVDLRLRCASDGYKFELQSNVTAQGGRVTGYWTESTYGISGRLSGSVKSGQVDVHVESPQFSALLVLRTNGNRQSISIRAAGQNFSESSITLTRG